MKGTLIVVGGPTASGKSAIAVEIARHFKAEVINADSRQFYKGMDIGTAKATKAERKGVPHHFLDFLEPSEQYTAGNFESDVLKFLQNYFTKNDYAVMVGGSGLYLQAVMEGFDELPSSIQAREKYNKLYAEKGIGALQDLVKRFDPDYFSKADIQNPRRLVRALEVYEISGKPYSLFRQKQSVPRPFNTTAIALMPDREALYKKIDDRVDDMMEKGLLEEVERLMPFKGEPALKTVGYTELFTLLDGHWDLHTAIQKIKQHSRNYAKRQYTWFKKQGGYHFFTEPDILHILGHLKKQLSV